MGVAYKSGGLHYPLIGGHHPNQILKNSHNLIDISNNFKCYCFFCFHISYAVSK